MNKNLTMSVAIVTGGASGMGLALIKSLVARGGYKGIVVADLQPPPDVSPIVSFFKSDVTSWENQTALFKFAWEKYGRLDLVVLNAGVADLDDMYADSEDGPQPLNLKTLAIDVNGPLYGIRQALWYMRRNPGGSSGKIVITSSSSGFYAYPINPQYCAAKHAVC